MSSMGSVIQLWQKKASFRSRQTSMLWSDKTFFLLQTGNTLNSHKDFIHRLKRQVRLQEVFTVADCDFILVFCPVISRAGTDIEAAVKKLQNTSGTKPAVLVVLHHTFDPECVVPDSSRVVHRENTITVDCLFHEDMGLLQCYKNNESMYKTVKYINPQIKKFFVLLTGNTLNSNKDFIDRLQKQIHLQEVSTVDQCDFILVFCPVVSRAGTDIEAAVKKLQNTSETKPAVLVVLHHTFDPECVVPDSSRAVHRTNTVTIDCLFHEDKGLLQCHKNDESLTKTLEYIKCQINNFFVLLTGNTLNSHKYFIDRLQKQIHLQEVSTVDQCDFILVFCPVVSRAGIDIEAAVKKLQNTSETKPAVLVVLHHTFDPECVVPDSSRAVHRTNTVTVDCLFHEDMGLLQCHKNDESLTKTLEYIKCQKTLQGQENADMSIIKNTQQGHNDQTRNLQTVRDRQLNSKYLHIQKEQSLVEKMEKTLVEWQKEMDVQKEQLKEFKKCVEINEKILSEKDAELGVTNYKLNENEKQLKNTVKELETSRLERERQLQEMMIVLEKQKTELAEKNKQLEEKERLLTERETQLMERDKEIQEKDKRLLKILQKLEENETLVKQIITEFVGKK